MNAIIVPNKMNIFRGIPAPHYLAARRSPFDALEPRSAQHRAPLPERMPEHIQRLKSRCRLKAIRRVGKMTWQGGKKAADTPGPQFARLKPLAETHQNEPDKT